MKNTFIDTPVVPSKTKDQSGQNLYPFSDQNAAKTIPFGEAYTYVIYISPPPPPPLIIIPVKPKPGLKGDYLKCQKVYSEPFKTKYMLR